MKPKPPVDFDAYTASYADEVNQAIRFSGRRHDFFLDAKVELFRELLEPRIPDLERARVLDVGCGVGVMASKLAPRLRRLVGVEIAGAALQTARHRVPEASFCRYDGTRLPFSANTFDIVLTSCVLHHVPPAQWPRFTEELVRATAPGGAVLVFEHNPWNPLTRWAVRQCEFDRDAVLLRSGRMERLLGDAGAQIEVVRYFLLTPWSSEPWRSLERWVARLPFGAQYAVLARVWPP